MRIDPGLNNTSSVDFLNLKYLCIVCIDYYFSNLPRIGLYLGSRDYKVRFPKRSPYEHVIISTVAFFLYDLGESRIDTKYPRTQPTKSHTKENLNHWNPMRANHLTAQPFAITPSFFHSICCTMSHNNIHPQIYLLSHSQTFKMENRFGDLRFFFFKFCLAVLMCHLEYTVRIVNYEWLPYSINHTRGLVSLGYNNLPLCKKVILYFLSKIPKM